MSLLARRSTKADDCFDSYLRWREASEDVRHAYRHWVNAGRQARDLGFAIYCAALDWEEHAASIYSARLTQPGAIARGR